MRLTYVSILVAAVALPVAVAAASFNQATPNAARIERAQLPPPFGARPPLPGQQCKPDMQKILKLQRDAFKAMQRLTRRDGEKLCASLESADALGISKFLDPKSVEPLLTPEQRELLGAFGIDLSKIDVDKIMRLLGVDLSQIDMRQLKQQCRASQGQLDEFATRELNRVEEQLLRCDDRV